MWTLNPDFELVKDDSKDPPMTRIMYKGTCICIMEDDPIKVEKWLATFGYLAEHSRKRLNWEFEPGTSWVNWTEDMRVEVWTK